MYTVHLRLVGKIVVDFLFVLILFFSLGVTAEELWANTDRKSALLKAVAQFPPNFHIVERVHDFKLLGVYVDSTLSWTKHVEHIAKATKRLHFLKVLKRAGLPPHHLLHYYVAVIRPVLEYCSCIWHHNITNKLSLQIEAIQKRAIKIIFECTRDMSYANCLYLTELSSLQHRRQQQARDFFRSLLDPNSCLHILLPTPRDPNLVTRLPAARRFPALASRTKKYQSFINFGLLN